MRQGVSPCRTVYFCLDRRSMAAIRILDAMTSAEPISTSGLAGSCRNTIPIIIVRRIDDLGRVVIPKEIRRTMRIREGEMDRQLKQK